MLVKLVKKKNLACYKKKGEGFAEELNKKYSVQIAYTCVTEPPS